MKQLLLQIGLLLLLAACQQEVVPEKTGEKVTLSFDFYNASLTKADDASSAPDTLMPVGKKFRAYAYPKGETTTGSPSATGIYTVADNGIAEGDMTLYRGDYDIYLVSYFDENYVPELGGDNFISVSNEKDFMYTTLKGVSVRPASSGLNKMKIPITTPFTRLCSNIILKVQANKTQPVTVGGLKVNSITINNLSTPLSYQLGESDWHSKTTGYTESLSTSKFSQGGAAINPRESDPMVVLPIDGTTALKFNVNLQIQYDKNNTGDASKYVTENFNYEASVRKIFLPGMTYVFEFTLTFFGTINPTDLTLGILEYTTVSDNTDEVGK